MSLYQTLQKASSEEDVKKTYIKALKLTQYELGLIDIQTKEVWFEAKYGNRVGVYTMFAQLIRYVDEAKRMGKHYPPMLCVIDQKKAALVRTRDIMVLFDDKEINISLRARYRKSASQVAKPLADLIENHIHAHVVHYDIAEDEAEFIDAVKKGINSGDFQRIRIKPVNMRQAFDTWVVDIGLELEDTDGNAVADKDMAVFFYADLMYDGKAPVMDNLSADLIIHKGQTAFMYNGTMFKLRSTAGYENFWRMYHRPPHKDDRADLLSRRDSLLPLDEQAFKGAFYTPLHVVDKAYDLLTETLGENWQKEYILWDMCCGVGNLEAKRDTKYFRNVYMSTLDQADVDIMKSSNTFKEAEIFQYDYLNDDISPNGEIDYLITDKVPLALRRAIADGKKILVLINPPYAEATSSDNVVKGETSNTKSKIGVQGTLVNQLMREHWGPASKELYTQFMARVYQEIPNATLSIFSKLKILNAPNFEPFRDIWKAKFLGGFIVHSKAFDGLKGNFPIGFTIWNQSNRVKITNVTLTVLDKKARYLGTKTFYNLPAKSYLNKWLSKIKANDTVVIPLKNAITPYTSKPRRIHWADNAIAHLWCNSNDMQQAGLTALFSSCWGGFNQFYVTAENLDQVACMFAVRRVTKPTWINDRDQFLQPTEPLTEEFKDDCLTYMLFHGSNLSAGANGLEWDSKKWSITNHFVPFSPTETGGTKLESYFMVDYLTDKTFSREARAVMDEGKKLWSTYFSQGIQAKLNKAIRDKLKLGRSDVGWYQIRNALKELGVDFSDFEKAYKALTEKLQPQVYTLGFLKP